MTLASGEKATPHGAPAGAVGVSINNVPRGTFAPTGRLVAYGGAGLTDISVDDTITLPVWLFDGIGHQDLHVFAEPVVHQVAGEIVGRGGDAVRYPLFKRCLVTVGSRAGWVEVGPRRLMRVSSAVALHPCWRKRRRGRV